MAALNIIRMSSVESKPVHWLWEPYIPYGAITIIQGDGGQGKTTLSLAIASAATTGEHLPGEYGGGRDTAPINVIIQNAEDSYPKAIKPKLEQLGADCDRVHIIDEEDEALSFMDERIEQAITATGARLAILDPIQAYVGRANMNAATSIRPIMKHLSKVAERSQCAILLVGHLSKGGGKAQYRGLGSIDIFSAVGHAMITLHEVTGEQTYWDIALSKLDYLRDKAPRFADHVLQHTVSANNDFPEQAWADTLFMAAFFMLRMGVKLKDETIINDALDQYYWHIKYLQHPETGLWYHGYDHIARGHMSGFFWGRANAWAAYTMSQVGRYLPEAYLYPRFMDVAGSLKEQLSALKLLQTPGGLWRTLLDDAEAYEEVSASCGIAAAMTAQGNPLHLKYIVKALDGALAHISPDGRVLNVSGGTAVMRDRDGYRNISRDWIQGWGQGLALTFLSAALRLDKGRNDGAL